MTVSADLRVGDPEERAANLNVDRELENFSVCEIWTSNSDYSAVVVVSRQRLLPAYRHERSSLM